VMRSQESFFGESGSPLVKVGVTGTGRSLIIPRAAFRHEFAMLFFDNFTNFWSYRFRLATTAIGVRTLTIISTHGVYCTFAFRGLITAFGAGIHTQAIGQINCAPNESNR
jgi:hypothetical protein